MASWSLSRSNLWILIVRGHSHRFRVKGNGNGLRPVSKHALFCLLFKGEALHFRRPSIDSSGFFVASVYFQTTTPSPNVIWTISTDFQGLIDTLCHVFLYVKRGRQLLLAKPARSRMTVMPAMMYFFYSSGMEPGSWFQWLWLHLGQY